MVAFERGPSFALSGQLLSNPVEFQSCHSRHTQRLQRVEDFNHDLVALSQNLNFTRRFQINQSLVSLVSILVLMETWN